MRQVGLPLLFKRVADLAALLVLAGPALFLVIVLGIAIRLESRGPALFKQERVGRDRRHFTCYKLRTMKASASEAPHRDFIAKLMKHEISAGGDDPGAEAIQPGKDGLYKLTDDRRITRIGGVLRSLSLDELPQLYNVLRGEMSLVGPRPVVPYELEHYEPEHFKRFDVLPGLTGLWQVNGRSRLSYREMLELDLEYVRTWTPALDASVFVRTFSTLLRGALQAR